MTVKSCVRQGKMHDYEVIQPLATFLIKGK